ncbi:phage major capsid protein [Candidatus Poribacteria bacterium]|nr:phage major capsid protein [Candidatus Poribacteria bacterium]
MAYLGLSERNLEAYSLTRAMRALAFPDNSEYQKDAAFEKDLSSEAQKIEKRDVSGILIPDDIASHRAIPMGLPDSERALLAGTPTAGGYTVDDELQSIIDIFLELNWASENVTVLSGLQGNVQIPGQDERAVAEFVGETGAATESEASFLQKTLTPRQCRTYLRITKQLLVQSHESIEMFLRRDLSRAIAKRVDEVLLYGIGTNAAVDAIAAYDFDVATYVTYTDTATWEAQTGKKWTLASIAGQNYILFKGLVAADTTALGSIGAGRQITISESGSVVLTVGVSGEFDSTGMQLPIGTYTAASLSDSTDYVLQAVELDAVTANHEAIGISETAGIHAVTYDGSTVAKREATLIEAVLDCEERLARNNVPGANSSAMIHQGGMVKVLMSPRIRRYMKNVKFFGDYTDEPLLSRDDMLLGEYPAYRSTNVKHDDFFFCDWKDAALGLWTGIELLENPYSEDKEGIIRITAENMVDVAVYRPNSMVHVTKA